MRNRHDDEKEKKEGQSDKGRLEEQAMIEAGLVLLWL